MNEPISDAPIAKSLSNQRLETLVDGVFAIVLTLLVLDIKAPDVASDAELFHSLLTLGSKLFSYLFSFLVLGIFWFGHQMESHYIHRSDRVHLWLNLLFLLGIAFLPFSASILGAHPFSRIAVIIYSSNLCAVGLVRYVHWQYVVQHRLISAVDPQLVRALSRAFLGTPIFCCFAIGLSFLNVTLSLVLLTLLMPLNVAFRISHLFHKHIPTEPPAS